MENEKWIISLVKNLSIDEQKSREFEEILEEEMHKLATLFNIGKIEIDILSKDTIYSIKKNKFKLIPYLEEEYNKKTFVIEHGDKKNGLGLISFYPKKDHEFTNEEKEYITLSSNIIYNFYKANRLDEILEKSMITDSKFECMNMLGLSKIGYNLKKRNRLQYYDTIYFNLQDFKYINNEVGGMKNGDKVLVKYCKKIKSILAEDEYFGRAAGDNFFILSKKENRDKIIDSINNIDINFNKLLFNIKCYIGIYPNNESDDINESLDNAMLTMNVSKRDNNKSILIYNNDIRDNLLMIKKIKNLLPVAIKKNDIVAFYQPKVDINTGMICGSEALSRWEYNGEIKSPGEYIPILERENLISELDFYMFEQVCKDMRKFIDSGIEPVKTSINFSKQNFSNPDFSNEVLKIIDSYDLDKELIEIELLETMDLKDYDSLLKFANEMKKHNISIAIDDFGTGFSSLKLLNSLEATTIKIDKSFIDHIDDEKDVTILKSIISMIKGLNMDIVVEGVETKKQVDFLRENKCDVIQGYYYDKPLEKSEYVKRLVYRKYDK